jgi:hypothetical protein
MRALIIVAVFDGGWVSGRTAEVIVVGGTIKLDGTTFRLDGIDADATAFARLELSTKSRVVGEGAYIKTLIASHERIRPSSSLPRPVFWLM